MEPLASIDEVIALLNRALEADPDAVTQLINTRVECNETLAADPTIQVGGKNAAGQWVKSGEAAHTYCVGILGIINGIFVTRDDGRGHIAAFVDEASVLVTRFERT